LKKIATQLSYLINSYLPLLNKIDEDEFAYKPFPLKWSKKEVMGHLIDSAQNNIRRFIIAQYEENPTIIYDQDKWVHLNNYQQQEPQMIIQFWYLLNKQIIEILENITDENSKRTSKSEGIHTLEWLALDYVNHLKHHVHIVLNMEPVSYP